MNGITTQKMIVLVALITMAALAPMYINADTIDGDEFTDTGMTVAFVGIMAAVIKVVEKVLTSKNGKE